MVKFKYFFLRLRSLYREIMRGFLLRVADYCISKSIDSGEINVYFHHAEREFQSINNDSSDDKWNKKIRNDVFRILKYMGAIGFHQPMARSSIYMLSFIIDFKLFSPLTGVEWECEQITDDLLQNQRCPRIVKVDGSAYDYLTLKSIKFPYEPTSNN
jgi:hypothetical protein